MAAIRAVAEVRLAAAGVGPARTSEVGARLGYATREYAVRSNHVKPAGIVLQKEIDELRVSEREHNTRQKIYLEAQLIELGRTGTDETG